MTTMIEKQLGKAYRTSIPFVIYDDEFNEPFLCDPEDSYDVRRVERILSIYPKNEIVTAIDNTIRHLYNISMEDVRSRDRHHGIKDIRHVVCYILRRYNKLSYPLVGNIIKRDHATAWHSTLLVERSLNGWDDELLGYHDAIVGKLKTIGAI